MLRFFHDEAPITNMKHSNILPRHGDSDIRRRRVKSISPREDKSTSRHILHFLHRLDSLYTDRLDAQCKIQHAQLGSACSISLRKSRPLASSPDLTNTVF